MTRKLLSAVALMVAVFFTGSIAAEAADVTFGGQIRPRYENWNLSNGADSQFINMRVRLNTKVKIDDNTSAFIQFQSNTRFGTTGNNTGNAGGGGQQGSVSDNFAPNEHRTDVGLHQAYFTIKNLFGLPVALQPGRQEIVLDGHRLFGHTGWTQGAQTHDAVKISHSEGNHTLAYFFSKVQEETQQGIGAVGALGLVAPFTGASTDDVDDTDAHILWANMKGLLGAGSSTSAYLVLVDQDCNSAAAAACAGGTVGSADFYTIGARHAGKAGAISYRGEFYYQTGKSGISNPLAPGETGDVDAYMIGLRAGYKAANVAMKPSITLWYDHLSGSNGTDAANGDQGGFNTLFDTGHKFYGFMDFFLGFIQAGGLHDAAVKIAIQPMAKTTLKVDLHHFARTSDNGSGAGAPTLGQEADITLVHKYSPSTKFVLGYSRFFTRERFSATDNNDDQDWLYVMVDLKF